MISVILLMAGSGSRMKINENKVFLPLKDKMVYEYSLELFLKYQFHVVCVIRKEDLPYLKKYEGQVTFVFGGTTRQESVYNGLQAAKSDQILIHDAARPFITSKLLEKCISALKENHACLVVSPCKDTVYERPNLRTLNRDQLLFAQTPQGGNRTELLLCHQKAIQEHFTATDDISLILKYGHSLVELIEGTDQNFKITTQLDYIIAKEWCKHV